MQAETLPIRVIKVGGSLLTLPDLKQRLMEWAGTIADDRCVNVWIVGGGAFVDEVRNWQALHGLDPNLAHRISIGLMSQTAELFQGMFLDWPLLLDIQSLNPDALGATSNVVFDCCHWAQNNVAVQRSWETTSDTISLQLAIAVGASHLFLLKSKSPKSDRVIEAIEDGLIDRNFSSGCTQESRLRTSMVNLRESNTAIELLW